MMRTMSARKLNEWAAYFQLKEEQRETDERRRKDASSNESNIRNRRG